MSIGGALGGIRAGGVVVKVLRPKKYRTVYKRNYRRKKKKKWNLKHIIYGCLEE